MVDTYIPAITILLCTNTYDKLLERAIESCLSQTYTEFELLIIVNGEASIEVSDSIKNKYCSDYRLRIFHTSVRHLNFSLSLGLHFARGRLIARMDADDVMHPERLEIQKDYLDKNSSVVVLGSNYRLIDKEGRDHGLVKQPMENKKIRRQLFYRCPICHPSVMFRTEIVRSYGGYLGGKNAEDYDLWVRISSNKSYKFYNLDQALLFYNIDASSPARRSRVSYSNCAAAALRNFLFLRDLKWLFAAFVFGLKSFLLSNKP